MASRASPLGRARAACLEWSALLLADRGADDGGLLLLARKSLCKIAKAVVGEYAGRPLVTLWRSIAGRKYVGRFNAASANET